MTEREVSSERVSEERLQEIIAWAKLYGADARESCNVHEMRDMASELLALRSSVKKVGPTPYQVLDAANDYAMEQYGMGFLSHPVDRQRILSAIEAPVRVSEEVAKPTVEQAMGSLVSALGEMRSQQAKRDEFLATLIVNIEKNEPTAEFAVNLREYVRNERAAALAAKGDRS